ncbi:MAG TPA: 30S ribosome-binding factor RbfA, partial [Acidimicrobiia bacterium]
MSDRMLRVNSIIREVLADEIERMNDARLEFVSVTGVDTSANLREAVVFVDVLGEDDRDDALRALQGASKRLQSVLAREVRMKYTPTLEFRMDPGVTSGQRIEQILRELEDEEDGSASEDAPSVASGDTSPNAALG